MTIYLLDINVLLGLLDHRNSLHTPAHQWFAEAVGADDGWATCPHTENGFLRVGMNAKFAGSTQPRFTTLMAALVSICQLPNHHFWTMDISLRTNVPPSADLTPNQIADIYLLALAIEHGGKLATFDQKIPAHLLPGGPEALEVISS